MSKRAERRHHEKRVKDKFRDAARRWIGRYDSLVGKWEFKQKGGLLFRKYVLDPRGLLNRSRWIENQAVRRAHHPQHQCVICHPSEKELRRRREFEIKKKSREEDE